MLDMLETLLEATLDYDSADSWEGDVGEHGEGGNCVQKASDCLCDVKPWRISAFTKIVVYFLKVFIVLGSIYWAGLECCHSHG